MSNIYFKLYVSVLIFFSIYTFLKFSKKYKKINSGIIKINVLGPIVVILVLTIINFFVTNFYKKHFDADIAAFNINSLVAKKRIQSNYIFLYILR